MPSLYLRSLQPHPSARLQLYSNARSDIRRGSTNKVNKITVNNEYYTNLHRSSLALHPTLTAAVLPMTLPLS